MHECKKWFQESILLCQLKVVQLGIVHQSVLKVGQMVDEYVHMFVAITTPKPKTINKLNLGTVT